MNKFYRLLTGFLFATLVTGCEENPQMLSLVDGDDQEASDSVESLILSKPVFSSDYKTIVLDANLGKGIGTLSLADPSMVRVLVDEEVHGFGEANYPLPPKLVKVENIASQKVAEKQVKMLALVDLTLSQTLIDQELRAVEEMRNLFNTDNLCVAFIEGTTVTETMPATNYVLEKYFLHKEAPVKYLYRSILTKMDEMETGASWTANARYTSMVVMSDGATYFDDLPMDPNHFELEQQLALRTDKRPFYYANFSETQSDDDDLVDIDNLGLTTLDDDDESTVLQSLCMTTGGLYQQQFDFPAIEDNILTAFDMKYADYRFTLENPDNKVYRGRHGRDLKILCYDAKTDSLLVSGNCYYSLGSVYSPVIVNPRPIGTILLQGFLYALFIGLLVWLVLQFAVPFVRYRLFLRKHVLTYTGPQMSVDNTTVAQSCYLCKAPFAVGDQIVTKCQHTMHLGCWDENDYQCPEYGRHCHEGRHYYNRRNLLDPQNSTFYLNWILVAILAAFVAWVAYTSQVHPYLSTVAERITLSLTHMEANSPDATDYFTEYGSHVNHYPAFGLCIGFSLTLFLSILSVVRRDLWLRVADVFVRAILGGLGGLLFFTLGGIISVVMGFDQNVIIVDWIPWTLTAYWIALCVSWGTRIRISHKLLVAAIIVGLLSTYLWTLLYSGSTVDYRVTLLFNFMLFAVVIAVSIAQTAPRSERYFLAVNGNIKQMDIALYKWFKANPNDVVTIGHSVDCHLQLSWDIQGSIAPVQAEIRQQRGVHWLYALEDGVFIGGKPLSPEKAVRLYHGRTFTIGSTTFTYIEKDN